MKQITLIVSMAMALTACASAPTPASAPVVETKPEARSYHVSDNASADVDLALTRAFPGRAHRLDAAVQAGRTAGVVMGGVIVMLLLAGLLEGFGRQLIADTGLRYAVAAVTALIWGLYFYGPRREASRVR